MRTPLAFMPFDSRTEDGVPLTGFRRAPGPRCLDCGSLLSRMPDGVSPCECMDEPPADLDVAS